MPPSNRLHSDCARFRRTLPAEPFSSSNGLRAAIPAAQAFEPQHGRISFAASSDGRRFQRASTSLMSSARPRPASPEIPPRDCPPLPPDISRSIEYRRSAESPPTAVFLAKASSDGSISFPVTIRSVSANRSGTGATLPTAMRTSSTIPPAQPPQRRNAHLGNRLRVARSNFARIGKCTRKSPREAYGPNQFIGGQFRLLVTRVKILVRHAPLATNRDQNKLSLVRQQRGQRIGRRRGVHDIAAERAAILVGNSAGPARSARQQRELSLHRPRARADRCTCIQRQCEFRPARLQCAAAREDSRC